MQNTPTTSVYIILKKDTRLIGINGLPGKGYHYKIGISDNPEKRLNVLNNHSDELELISEYATQSRHHAQYVEKALHDVMFSKNIKGEWFYLEQDELIIIDNLLVDIMGLHVCYHDKEYFIKKRKTSEERLAYCKLDLINQNFFHKEFSM